MKRERHRKCVDMCNRDKAEDKSKCTPINATMHNPPQVITTTETTDCVPCPVDRKYTHMKLHSPLSTPTIQKTFRDYSESILESPSWAEWSEWSNDGADKPCGEGTNLKLH